jgi:ADP-ribosylglycohydrolase
MPTLSLKDRLLGGLWGAVIGDALGVPVEFESRAQVARHPVTGMRGYGTYNQPAGTWSDDSSLLICTVESLLSGFDTQDMAGRFVRWLDEGYWTPWGKVFDVGGATRRALYRIKQGVAPDASQAGGDDEQSNGNGSLMRILPIALRFADASPSELVEYAHRASSLTHRHPRSQMACGIYCLIVAALLKGADPQAAYLRAIQAAQTIYQQPPYTGEMSGLARLLSGQLERVPEADIRATGYVLDTLEASVWCLLNTYTFEQTVLRAVNLGDDTDTTGTVTGGLAGVYYGLGAIPTEWLASLARHKDLSRLFEAFVTTQPALVE